MPNEENYQPGLKYGNKLITNDLADGAVTGVKMTQTIAYLVKSIDLGPNITEQTLFGTSGLAVAATITGIYASALDSTVGNVALGAGTASVGTVVLNGFDNEGTANAGPDAELANVQVSAGTNVYVTNSARGGTAVQVFFETD